MNPKDALGAQKPQLHLVPSASLIHEALAMENGAKKYGPFNWRHEDSGVHASVYVGAALRHLASWFDGEAVAEDSGVHHLAHAKACCGILLDAIETGHLVDDRPPVGAASRLLAPRSTKAAVPVATERTAVDALKAEVARIQSELSVARIEERIATISSKHDGVAKELDRKGYLGD